MGAPWSRSRNWRRSMASKSARSSRPNRARHWLRPPSTWDWSSNPIARLTNRPYSWEDVVSLLRPEEKPGLPPTDSRYLAASLMLELGIYVAAADGSVEDVEVDQVARFLESQFLLDPPDARRLEALKRVFVARPPSLAGLGKRLQTALTREQREAVGRFLTGIAAANGSSTARR